MTDKEKKERIDVLEIQIKKLREERDKYQKELVEKKRNDEVEKRKKLIGKCFVQNTDKVGNNRKEILAFKILELLTPPNENYAKCLVVHNGTGDNCWTEQSIKICVLGLWTKNASRLMYYESDPNIIDFYKKIPNSQFELLLKDYFTRFEQCLEGEYTL